MPSQRDVPSGIGATNDWGLYGPGAVNQVQAVAVDDGDNSVVYAASGGAHVRELYTFPALIGCTDPVTSASLSVVTRQYAKGGGGREYYLVWNSTQIVANRAPEVYAVKPAYTTMTYNAAAGTLALAVVNGQHGMEFWAAGGPSNKAEYWVTHVYRDVTYAYASATTGDTQFAHLLGSIAACIGANLLLREMPAVSRALGKIRLLPDEYERAWRAWREYKHPAWSV